MKIHVFLLWALFCFTTAWMVHRQSVGTIIIRDRDSESVRQIPISKAGRDEVGSLLAQGLSQFRIDHFPISIEVDVRVDEHAIRSGVYYARVAETSFVLFRDDHGFVIYPTGTDREASLTRFLEVSARFIAAEIQPNQTEPNKALEPIPVNVTIPAAQEVAPFTSMAHL
jgi:hypothetical protein